MRKRQTVKQMPRQKGVALITAMLVVAIAALVAADVAWEQNLQMRRSAAMLAHEQGKLYGLGAEAIAIDILLEDRDDPNEVDHLSETWADEWAPVEVDEGSIQGSVEDMQGRFNINNIYRNGQVDQIAMEQFRRLLRILELDEAVADSVLDWIDPDQEVCCAAGAEDDTYTSLTPPYRAANRYLTSTSELQAVANMTPEIFRTLQPYISALPPGWCGSNEITHINVNTASEQVLLAISADVTQGNVDQWVAEREDQDGYRDLNAFSEVVAEDVLAGRYIGLNSECFAARSLITVGSFRVSMYSLLDRQGQADSIVTRLRYFGVY